MVYYHKPMHLQQALSNLKMYQECPVTERLCKTVLSLPMHPYMKNDEIEFIVNAINNYYKVK